MELKLNQLVILMLMLLLISCQSEKKTDKKPVIKYEVPDHLSKQKTSYLLISHSDTKDNKRLSNTELSEKGFEQAAFWGNYFSDKEIDLFYTSSETFAFQTIIPIVHPYKGQVRNLDKELQFDKEFWSKTYGQKSIIVSSDQQNTGFINEVLQYRKYKVKDIKDENYLIKVNIDKKRNIKDTIIKF